MAITTSNDLNLPHQTKEQNTFQMVLQDGDNHNFRKNISEADVLIEFNLDESSATLYSAQEVNIHVILFNLLHDDCGARKNNLCDEMFSIKQLESTAH